MKWISCALLLLGPAWLVAAAPVADSPGDADEDQLHPPPESECGVNGHSGIVRFEAAMLRWRCSIESKKYAQSEGVCDCWRGYVRGLLASPVCYYNDRTRTWVAEGNFAFGPIGGAEAQEACYNAVQCARAAAGCASGQS